MRGSRTTVVTLSHESFLLPDLECAKVIELVFYYFYQHYITAAIICHNGITNN